jgi:hypothetical protein
MGSIGSCKRINMNHPETTLNYQRRNKQKQSITNLGHNNNNSNHGNHGNRPREPVFNCKKREVSGGKGRSSEKS